MSHTEFPQDLTDDEKDLGFELLWVEKIGGSSPWSPEDAIAVVRILSTSDILLKILDGVYSHRRYGNAIVAGEPERETTWNPVSVPIKEAASFLQEIQIVEPEESHWGIVPKPFKYWKTET